jgi:fission protein ELM1
MTRAQVGGGGTPANSARWPWCRRRRCVAIRASGRSNEFGASLSPRSSHYKHPGEHDGHNVRGAVPKFATEVRLSVAMNCTTTCQAEMWVLLTEAIVDNGQCMALAQAVGRPVAIKRLDWPAADPSEDRRKIAELLDVTTQADERRHAFGLRAPWPRIVVCCGRRADRVAFWIRRQSAGNTKIVGIGRSRRPLAGYDMLIASPQFPFPKHAKVIRLPLPMARPQRATGSRD